MSSRSKNPWTKPQIRQARLVHLAPLLQRRGVRLQDLDHENYGVAVYNDLMIKHHYWRWPSRNLAGNAIDFFVQVEEMSFHEAMGILVQEPED